MTRAALYARYSTDKQRETSIVDQLREAQARAAREGWEVAVQRADEGVSGSVPIALRPGGKALLADALAGRFSILIVEGLDRLTRDIGEQESVVKRLEHRGIRIVGTADGYDTVTRGRKVMRIARGLVNEMYLDDLREKTHRGLAGQFDRGFSAGGRTYGYRTVEDIRGRRMVIDANESPIVQEVFRRYSDGEAVARIVANLNARGIPSARGGSWAVSAIFGSTLKGLGMLSNELYRGHIIWNRRQWIKDPETGRRNYIERPKEEWQHREDPSLRIIEEDLWMMVQSRRRSRGAAWQDGQVRIAKPGRTLFGGLLVCPTCGGPIIAVNSKRYGCNVHKDRGPAVCSNSQTISREMVDRRLITEVRDQLMDPAAISELRGAVKAALAMAQKGAESGSEGAKARLAEIDAEISRLVDALASIGLSEAIATRLKKAEAERDQLTATLATAKAGGATGMLQDIMARYSRLMMKLQDVLKDGDIARSRELLSDLLGPITLRRDDDGVAWAEFEEPAERLMLANGESLGLVAGAGFEPTTFGL